jgi:hypothetical protein
MKNEDVQAIPMEDWLRGCVYHDGRHGEVTLPCDRVLEIADYIQMTRTSLTEGLIGLRGDRAMTIEALQRKSINCNYTCSDCVHLNKSYEEEPCHSCFNNDGAGYEPVKHGKPSKEAELLIDEANAYKREKGEQDDK